MAEEPSPVEGVLPLLDPLLRRAPLADMLVMMKRCSISLSTGKKMRHVKVRNLGDIPDAQVSSWVREAVELNQGG